MCEKVVKQMKDSHFSAQLAMLRTTLQHIQKNLAIFTVIFDTEDHILYRDFGEAGENGCPMFASTEGWGRFKGLLALSAAEQIGCVDDVMGGCFYSFVPVAGLDGVKCVCCFIQSEDLYRKAPAVYEDVRATVVSCFGLFLQGVARGIRLQGYMGRQDAGSWEESIPPGMGISRKLVEILWSLAREIEQDENGWKKPVEINLREQYLLAIDPQNREIVYYNAAVGRLFPALQTAENCEGFFRPCGGRCEQCVIANLHTIGETVDERQIAPDGKVYALRFQLVKWYDGRSVCLVRGENLSDSNLHQRVDGGLVYQDQQLGVLNRICLMESLREIFQSNNKCGTLLLVDLDKFRIFNETFGHACGDEALAAVVEYLRGLFPGRPVFRFEGDQFIIVLRNTPVQAAETYAHQILERFGQPWVLSTVTCTCKVNIGIAAYGDADTDIDRTLNHLGYALMEAKQDRYRAYVVFDETLQKKVERDRQIRACVIRAAEQDAFALYYQPIFDVRAGCYTQLEALLRVEAPELGGVSPAEFIPCAEDMGMITKIGYRVLDRACALYQKLRQADAGIRHIAINLSAVQVLQQGFVEEAQRITSHYGIAPSVFVFEFKESLLRDSFEAVREGVCRMAASGFGVVLDNYGSGQSTLTFMGQIPVSKIKIDKSYITQLGVSDTSKRVVQSIVKLAKQFGIKTVASGVETQVQDTICKKLKCDYIQGYMYEKPLHENEVVEYFRQQHTTE